MATFLVERYWPGVTMAAARAVSEAVVTGADGTTVPEADGAEEADGAAGAAGVAANRVRVVETILAASDEVCFWYVEAASVAAVEAAFATAAIPIDRITRATALESGPRAATDPDNARTDPANGAAR